MKRYLLFTVFVSGMTTLVCVIMKAKTEITHLLKMPYFKKRERKCFS